MTVAPLPNSGRIRVNAVTCDEHGDVLPEMISAPFTVEDAAMLGAMPFGCTGCMADGGDEQALIYPPEVDWEPAAAPLPQHWLDIGHDPDATPPYYPIWEIRPTARSEFGDPVYRTGSRLPNPEGPIERRG